MRINVYAEEITNETELVTKTVVPNGQTEPVTFYGIRFYLASPDELHHTDDDDDRSAITLWAKWTAKDGTNTVPLYVLVNELRLKLDAIGRIHEYNARKERERNVKLS